ncbi:TonB-dependent receptor [Yeosuana marina]|uniref:TonB-dependent receptor n=1 Tax=Yeosuana marina TaxID=1565536 RepID=UPI0030EC5F89|tara:strand:+ start:2737 stop:5127 length:2391 start_codon:yes stop_codon:yes gene_type:complete
MKIINQILLFIVCIANQLVAQNTQNIHGKIMSVSNIPIEGVTVVIEKTDYYDITNANGDFTISNVNAGDYKLVVSHIGFNSKTIDMSVTKGNSITLKPIYLKEAYSELQEVVISGSILSKTPNAAKSGIKALDLPQSVAIISQQTLETQQINSLTDILKNANGLYIKGTTGGYQEELASRGYSLGSNNTFKNGVRYFNGMTVETSGLESVEILKGSAAILFGNVEAGGILNLITKKPRFDFGGKLDVTFGSFNLVKPTFDVYGSLNDSKTVAFRLDGSYASADSFRKYVSSETYYFNPSLFFKLSNKTTLLLESDYTNDYRTPDFGAGIINYQIVDLPRDQFVGVKWGYFDAEQVSVTATLNHQLSYNWNVTYINSFRHYNTDMFTNGRPNSGGAAVQEDGTWQRNLQRRDYVDNYNLNQLDFKGLFKTGKVKHQFLVGADLENYKTKDTRYNSLTTANNNGQAYYDEINIFNPDYNNFRNDIPNLDKNRLTSTPVSRFGIYVQDLIAINRYLKVLAGVRYSYQDTKSDIYTYSNQSTSITNLYDDALTPRFGVIIQPTNHISIFGSYANSFETNTGLDIDGNTLKPSLIDQFEVGIKNELFNNKLFLNVTGYIINNSNLAQPYLGNGNTDSNIKELAGSTKSQGIEVDFTAYPLSGMRLMAGYSFNEMKYTKSNTYVVGSLLRYNPKHTANLSANYTFESGTLKGLNIGFVSTYFGERFAGRSFRITTPNDDRQLIPLSDYFQLDGTLAYHFNNKFAIKGKLANITNALNYNVHDDNSLNPIASRNYSVTLSYKF